MNPAYRFRFLVLLPGLWLLAACAGPGHKQLPTQVEDAASKQPVVSIQGYLVCDTRVEQQLKQGWTQMAELMEQKPGFIRAQLNRGSGASRLWIEISHWRSVQDLRSALSDAKVQQQLSHLPKPRFNHLFTPAGGGKYARGYQ